MSPVVSTRETPPASPMTPISWSTPAPLARFPEAPSASARRAERAKFPIPIFPSPMAKHMDTLVTDEPSICGCCCREERTKKMEEASKANICSQAEVIKKQERKMEGIEQLLRIQASQIDSLETRTTQEMTSGKVFLRVFLAANACYGVWSVTRFFVRHIERA
ncbi:hypothetical protein EJ08DRAFT_697451 [Tothia fuscella]|uniref:Uncharacterized protein n=1 Tax=Tothia fuscella TaxID=1048955 RepID=A0A9P4NQX5_9PEZI|nr:hypothetical protein EJ08DRAFT_697451 [Tothia fuscella]